MYIYLASSNILRDLCIGKIGCTEDPYGRLCTYRTGCPPGLTPSHDIEYDAIWKTNATTRDELYDLEDEVHDHFLRYRMMRDIPGDSEWFNFQGSSPYETLKTFMDSRQWVVGQLSPDDIDHANRKRTKYLRKQYHKNLDYLKDITTRDIELNKIQSPVISTISSFISDTSVDAGYVIAPCGSGKTVMTSIGIRGIKRCIICCPSKRIQEQWRYTLVNCGTFQNTDIHIIGDSGTTDTIQIYNMFECDTYCVISTYMSSHLLLNSISESTDVIVLDEAHHMAGIVSTEDIGKGRTRRLMSRAHELGIKRLSLTYTPRFIASDDNIKYLTMDDENIFGKKLAELKIRDMIRRGVLPDYRLWAIHDSSLKGKGIIGKAECILEAWDATEIVRGEETYILHHMIIFAETIHESKELERFFQSKFNNDNTTAVIRVEGGDKLDAPLQRFNEAKRAIMINCFVLNEGIDIPIANAVVITYPKQSRNQITQMVLRAGRWYRGKSIFHIIIPTLGEEDLSGFEDVLMALASCDERIYDEIILRSIVRDTSSSSDGQNNTRDADIVPESIMIEEFSSDMSEIVRCFRNIRRYVVNESRKIRDLCIQNGIDTSVAYHLLRVNNTDFPEDPLPKNMTWYDYLHPKCIKNNRISVREFIEYIVENRLHVGHKYDTWRNQQSDLKNRLPSVQHINDGFFGQSVENFDTLIKSASIRRVNR